MRKNASITVDAARMTLVSYNFGGKGGFFFSIAAVDIPLSFVLLL